MSTATLSLANRTSKSTIMFALDLMRMQIDLKILMLSSIRQCPSLKRHARASSRDVPVRDNTHKLYPLHITGIPTSPRLRTFEMRTLTQDRNSATRIRIHYNISRRMAFFNDYVLHYRALRTLLYLQDRTARLLSYTFQFKNL